MVTSATYCALGELPHSPSCPSEIAAVVVDFSFNGCYTVSDILGMDSSTEAILYAAKCCGDPGGANVLYMPYTGMP